MGMKFSDYKFLAVVLTTIFATPAFAEVPPLEHLNYQTRFDVSWNGIKIGRVRITVQESAFSYHGVFDLETHALDPFLRGEKTVVVADGVIKDGKYFATKYDSRGDKQPRTAMTYDAAGKIASRERVPDDDPTWRPPVPREEANTATDPVTAFFVVRQQLHDHIVSQQPQVSVRTYEGARLAEMNFKLISPANLKIRGVDRRAINVVATRKLINGYTPKEKKKYAEGDPPVHVYFSADGQFLPLKVEMQVFAGTLTATLVEIDPIEK